MGFISNQVNPAVQDWLIIGTIETNVCVQADAFAVVFAQIENHSPVLPVVEVKQVKNGTHDLLKLKLVVFHQDHHISLKILAVPLPAFCVAISTLLETHAITHLS